LHDAIPNALPHRDGAFRDVRHFQGQCFGDPQPGAGEQGIENAKLSLSRSDNLRNLFRREGGCPLVCDLGQALGHKSIASTAIYTVPTDETAGKAVLGAIASAF
jgi:hypothetical protein